MKNATAYARVSTGLVKRCSHWDDRTICRCDWVVNYSPVKRFNLTQWANTPTTILSHDQAEQFFAALKREVNDGTFNPEGRAGTLTANDALSTTTTGPTLNEFLDTIYKPQKFQKWGYHTDRLGDEFVRITDVDGTVRVRPAASLGQLCTVLIVQRMWGKERLSALANLTPATWSARFHKMQEERRVSARTMNRYFATMSAIFNWARTERLITDNPFSKNNVFKKDRAAEAAKRNRRLSRKHEAILIKECRRRWTLPISPDTFIDGTTGREIYRRIIGALDLGLRETELLAVRASWVDMRRGGVIAITVPAARHKGGKTTGEDRIVFAMTPRMQRMLRLRLPMLGATDGHVFGRENGEVCKSFDKSWKSLFSRVGIVGGRAGFTFHDLKHEFVSRAAAVVRNPEVLRQMAGHEDIRTTMTYMSTIEDQQIDGYEAMRVRPRDARSALRHTHPARTA